MFSMNNDKLSGCSIMYVVLQSFGSMGSRWIIQLFLQRVRYHRLMSSLIWSFFLSRMSLNLETNSLQSLFLWSIGWITEQLLTRQACSPSLTSLLLPTSADRYNLSLLSHFNFCCAVAIHIFKISQGIAFIVLGFQSKKLVGKKCGHSG